jgi:prolipoprotein diacylglyceryltransferase
VCALLIAIATPARAGGQDTTMPDVLVDGFYGGVIGALVGTAVMALTNHPRDHLSYISTGAAVGVITGTVYGLTRAANRALVEVDRGRVTWSVPSVTTGLSEDQNGRAQPTASAALFLYRFE